MLTRKELITLKLLLFLVAIIFAVAAVGLVIFYTSAATVTGQSPAASVNLVHGANTGILGPGEQRWFRFIPDQGPTVRVEHSLTLFFTPGNERAAQVALQIFDERQLPFFYQGQTSKMANLGAGQVISRDNNPFTGELFWTGWLFGQQSYYIQLFNGSDTPVDYWLFTENVISLPPSEIEQTNEAVSDSSLAVSDGKTPQTAIPLQPHQNKGTLIPGQEVWYSLSVSDEDGEHFEEAALTLVVTPDNGTRIWYTNFELFTARDVQNWWLGSRSDLNNIGAGSVVYRDHDPLTGERIWSGWLVDDDLYYVRLHNGADVPIDYWLFAGDVYNPTLE